MIRVDSIHIITMGSILFDDVRNKGTIPGKPYGPPSVVEASVFPLETDNRN